MIEYHKVVKVATLGNQYRNLILKELGWRSDYKDNGYVQGTLTDKNFKKAFEIAKKKQARIFFAHDYNPSYMMEEILEEFEIVICPVHSLECIQQYKKDYKWFGYETRNNTRTYTFEHFKRATTNHKRWSMGWRSLKDKTITHMHGFDTTMASSLSRYGKAIIIAQSDKGLITAKELVIKNQRKTEELIVFSIVNIDFYLRTLWHQSLTKKDMSMKSFYPILQKE